MAKPISPVQSEYRPRPTCSRASRHWAMAVMANPRPPANPPGSIFPPFNLQNHSPSPFEQKVLKFRRRKWRVGKRRDYAGSTVAVLTQPRRFVMLDDGVP